MTWVDTAVIVVVGAVGLAIMYKGLKEPIDLLGGLIARGFGSMRDKLIGMGEQREVIDIEYV